MANRVRSIVVTGADRAALERWQRAASTPAGLSRRARAVLLMAHGLSGVKIAERVGYTVSRSAGFAAGSPRAGWRA